MKGESNEEACEPPDGHSHTVMSEGENGEPILSTGTKLNYLGATVIDEAEKKVEGKFANGNRDGETNTGDFVTDAMKWYVMKDGADLGVPNENIVTILNGGSKKSYTIKKLSSGKRYYVKIIPYKNKGGHKYIGQYRIKSVKAK